MGGFLSFLETEDGPPDDPPDNNGTFNDGRAHESGVGCERNTDSCGRKAINGPTGPEYNGPNPLGSAREGDGTGRHCIFEGTPDCGNTACEDPACYDSEGKRITAADFKSDMALSTKYKSLHYGDINVVFNFSGKAQR